METIEIAIAADEAYFPGLLVTAASIARNASRTVNLNFSILDGGIENENFRLLVSSLASSHPHCSVAQFKIDESSFSELRSWNGNSRMAYARILLPKLLPSARFAIYTDADFLWTGDIAELWSLRDTSAPLQAGIDGTAETLKKERHWFFRNHIPFDPEKYICSGLMIMNLDSFRKENLSKSLLDFLKNHPDAPYIDQTAINATIAGIKILPAKWGIFARTYTALNQHETGAIHFAGNAPWRKGWWTNALTDAHHLWFQTYSELAGMKLRKSYRKFLPLREIIVRRATWIIMRHAILRIPFFLLLRLARRSCYIPELKELSK